jgi:hypothetical protein
VAAARRRGAGGIGAALAVLGALVDEAGAAAPQPTLGVGHAARHGNVGVVIPAAHSPAGAVTPHGGIA